MNDFDAGFTLQLFHLSDQEANTTSVDLAPNLSAVYNTLNAQDIDGDGTAGYADTLFLSSGDAWIPGLFYDASADIYGVEGAADILIQNELGIQAIAFGNHEFDNGTEVIGQLLSGEGVETPDGGLPFAGANFPYLSGNLDFSADENLAPLVVDNGQDVAQIPGGIAEWAVVETDGGERIGLVASTTPAIDDGLTSPGNDVEVFPEGVAVPETDAEFAALAATIQEDVDALLAANPDIDKVILLSHQQVLAVETTLAGLLTDVDIIMAGGSNAVLLDENDAPFGGEDAAGVYPIFETDAAGAPVAVVNTDAAYQYLGRLVIDFDDNGQIVPESYDAELSGAYATDDAGVARIGAEGNADPEIVAIADLVEETIVLGESNFFAVTTEFLNAERDGGGVDGVRNQETNLGNLTADANLFYVQQNFDDTVVASFKNGGGIRANIGSIVQPGGGAPAERVPPEGVPGAKPEGGISENDVADTLAFNNGLALLSLTAEQILAVLESTVANYSSLAVSAGDWGQFGGIRFSFDPSLPEGDRVVNAAIVDESTGELIAEIARDGDAVDNGGERFRIVTLDFLANGGNPGLPITDPEAEGFDPAVAEPIGRVDIAADDSFTGPATFAPDGSEQDALAEYLLAEFGMDGTQTVDLVDTSPVIDQRIQNLAFRTDTVFDSPVGTGVERASVVPGDDASVSAADVFVEAKVDEVRFRPIDGGFAVTGEGGSTDLLGVDSIAFVGGGLATASDSEAAETVALFYELALDRRSDIGGASYWSSRIEDGRVSDADVADAFVAASSLGGLGDAAYVDALLANGGITDNAFRDSAIAALGDGSADRGDVLLDLATSASAEAALENTIDDGVLVFV